MLGRKVLFEQLCNELTKPTPAHLSLVGPRYHGKSVILHALVATMRQRSDAYHRVIYWDLGHNTPQTDAEFLENLRIRIAKEISDSHPDLADYLKDKDSGFDDLHEVMENLAKEGKRILLVWDGFDRPLRQGRLTRNLWDNLLELCRMGSFRVVTASRRKLQELIRDEQSVTSELWQVFRVEKVACLTADDLEHFTENLPNHAFQAGALKELMNWTGGFPALVTWLLGKIAMDVPNGAVTNQHVNDTAVPDDQGAGILDSIWQDCPAPAADLYRHLAESGPQRAGDVPKTEKAALQDLGLARQDGQMLVHTCRLMEKHVGAADPEFGALARLFGTWDGYAGNIRGILERRISQIDRFDESLFHMVERAIEDIPDHPNTCLNSLTHIEDLALDLVWKRELGDDRILPAGVVSYWTQSPRDRHRFVAEMMKTDNWEVPGDRGPQLALLQLLTGSHQDFTQPKAKFTSKDTYVLLNAIHSFRNRSQHASGQAIHLGVAVSAVMLCVELLACLQRELQVGTTDPPISQP
jgi:hypothetical protein